jgi:hypothetical protein
MQSMPETTATADGLLLRSATTADTFSVRRFNEQHEHQPLPDEPV